MHVLVERINITLFPQTGIPYMAVLVDALQLEIGNSISSEIIVFS